MMPLDLSGSDVIRARLTTYLEVLGMDAAASGTWAGRACEDAAYGWQAFARLQELMAAEAPSAGGDEAGRAARFRLAFWMGLSGADLTALLEEPPLCRQSMAPERGR